MEKKKSRKLNQHKKPLWKATSCLHLKPKEIWVKKLEGKGQVAQ